jgi:hypothetical protein
MSNRFITPIIESIKDNPDIGEFHKRILIRRVQLPTTVEERVIVQKQMDAEKNGK